MPRKRFTPEQIIGMLRQADGELSKGRTVAEVSRSTGVSEQSCYRWRNEYGGLKVDQARRLRDVERECPSSEQPGRFEAVFNGGFGASGLSV